MTIVIGLTLSKICVFLATSGSNLKNCNFLSFCQILMIFIPKCSPFYVVLEKRHGAGEKGMVQEKRGMT